MASTIDATKPIAGNPTTDSVRVNFAAAKSEIEALQADVAAISAAAVPDATASVKGIVELATSAEVNTGTDTARVITPAGLEAWTGSAQITQVGTIVSGTWNGAVIASGYLPSGSTSQAGMVELADTAETNTGTDGVRAVTPLALEGWTGSAQLTQTGIIASGTWQGSVIAAAYLPDASTTAEGIVELATTAETTTGTDTARVVTPSGLKNGYQGSTNVTTLGTITTGTWNGSIIAEAYLQNQSGTNTGDEPDASETVKGIVELATTTEAAAGTDTSRAVTAAGVAEAALSRLSTLNTQTGTTYTLVDADKGKDLVFTNAATVTVTIPGTLAVGFQCTCSKLGAGNLVFTSADNLNGAAPDLTLSAQWSTAFLLQYSEGNWLVAGDVA